MIATLIDVFSAPLMQRALIVALLVGAVAPLVGTFLVQRSMALMGDGIGHVALTGVALGWLVGAALGLNPPDALAIPGSILASIAGAVLIEVVRASGRTGGDTALALLFYGGIAGGVILIRLAGGTTTNLTSYLFGSISTVSRTDLFYTLGLAACIVAICYGLRGPLFALAHDAEFAASMGLRVRGMNILVAVLAALTVSVSMRVVGVLLVSAIMIVPVAIAQLVSHSFTRTMYAAQAIATLTCVVGLAVTAFYPFSPGAFIVVLLIGIYTVVGVARSITNLLMRHRTRKSEECLQHP